MIELFVLENSKILPSEHCYNLKFLKDIMEKYPDNYIKIYSYIFYMTCPNDKLNPFFNMPEEEKEDMILQEIDCDFSTEDDLIIQAIDKCNQLYETPTMRAYKGMAHMIERLAKYMNETPITHGRDGNINSLVAAAAKFDAIRNSFKGVAKDLQEEQKAARRRGGSTGAYDQ